MEFSLIKDFILSVGAIGGLGLGIYNYKKDKKKDEVALKVKPISIHEMGDGKAFGYNEEHIQENRVFTTIGVKVINLSKFDITISEVGFKFSANNRGERLAFPDALALYEPDSLPLRLASRESVLIVLKSEQLPAERIRKDIESMYIATGCDLFFYGKNQVLDDFIIRSEKPS
jgi:hypothetical protein